MACVGGSAQDVVLWLARMPASGWYDMKSKKAAGKRCKQRDFHVAERPAVEFHNSKEESWGLVFAVLKHNNSLLRYAYDD